MTDTLPDRLSNNPRSLFFKEDVLKRDIGVRFNGVEKTNVEEYCISEGWVRVEVGKTKDRYGNPMTIRLNGKVEAYFKDKKFEQPAEAQPEQKPAAEQKPTTEQKPAAKEKTAKPEQPAKADKPAKAERTARGAKPGTAKSEKAKPRKSDAKSGKSGTKKKKK